MLVAERDERVVGYAAAITYRRSGYVRQLVVAPEARRLGVGRQLMTTVAERLRAVGANEWHLNVRRDNAPALALYEKLGLGPQYELKVVRLPWTAASRLPSPQLDAHAELVRPEQDARVEAAFGLIEGQVARSRGRRNQVLIGLWGAASEVVGVASFDPTYPGALPFRATTPSAASALLAAMKPYARPKPEWVQLVVENDPALCEALLTAGGELRLDAMHYRGPLR